MLVGLLVLINPEYYTFKSPLDLLVPVEAAALISLLGGVLGLRLAQRLGRVGRAGFLMSCLGLVAAGAGHLAGLPFFVFVDSGGIAYVLIGLSGGVLLVWGTVYVLGALVLSGVLVLLGLATLGTSTLPLWCGPALIAGLVGL